MGIKPAKGFEYVEKTQKTPLFYCSFEKMSL